MNYLEKAKEMYNMVGQGQMLDAFEKFYHDDVVMKEATGEEFKGKAANREREKQFVSNIKELHDGGVKGITSNEENATTMVESWMDLTFQDGNRIKMEEVAVQKWDGDKIIEEKFYYNPGSMMGNSGPNS